MSSSLQQALQEFVSANGYWAIALIVGLESRGIPLPGETILVLAAIYAATDPTLNIWVVIAAATIGSIMGDNAGYWIGRKYAYALLVRYGRYIGMSTARIKVGQYLFRQHGGKVVFLGRFVALLRILAAFLAGVNRMPWREFLIANAAGAVLWASAFGAGGYFFGKLLLQLHHSLAMVVFAVAFAAFLGVGYLINRYEHRLIEAAERTLPGPLEAIVAKKDCPSHRLENSNNRTDKDLKVTYSVTVCLVCYPPVADVAGTTRLTHSGLAASQPRPCVIPMGSQR